MQLVRLFDRESGKILKIFLNQRLLQLAYVFARKSILKSEIEKLRCLHRLLHSFSAPDVLLNALP